MTATENINAQNIAGAAESDIQIGQTYTIQRQDGTLHEAVVIQTRETEDKNKEFYVHYPGLNRRLDQWVTIDHIFSANNVENEDNSSVDINKSEFRTIFHSCLKRLNKITNIRINNNLTTYKTVKMFVFG